MPKLTIPEQEITTKQPKADLTITCFIAQLDGKLISPCEAFGNHKERLEAAMKSGEAIDAIEVKHNSERGRYDVKLPRDNARGGKGGGGGWRPAYTGDVIDTATFVAIDSQLLDHFISSLRAKLPNASDDTIAAQAAYLTAGYWPCVKEGVIKVGPLAAQAKQAGTQTRAASSTQSSASQPKPATSATAEKATRDTALNAGERKSLEFACRKAGLEVDAYVQLKGYDSVAEVSRTALPAMLEELKARKAA